MGRREESSSGQVRGVGAAVLIVTGCLWALALCSDARAGEADLARNVKVVCDRWPDGSSLRQFALDAIRLSAAKTEKEKALAVLRWMRRWTMFTDGHAPEERGQSVLDDMKILHVYGAHWCDGRALLMENLWRSAGGRAYKLYIPDGYTLAMVNWKDDDGVERWHQIHASRGWYVYDRAGKFIATPDDIGCDFSLMFRPSVTGIPRSGYPPRPWNWIMTTHRPFSRHDVTLDLRTGESYSRQWGNEGVFVCNNVAKEQYADGEHGGYEITYGNGRFQKEIDLTRPDPVERSAAAPGAADKMIPLRLPHVIADAWIEGEPPKSLAAFFMPDDKTRFPLPAASGGRIELGRKCTSDKNTVGRYAFPLHLSYDRRQVTQKSVRLTAIVQHNFFSLPQLWPGRNNVTVSAELAPGTALRVTYEWADAAGKEKKNVTVVEKTPHTYEILAAGRKWADVVCKRLTIEAVKADGKGNRTEVKEPEAKVEPLDPMPAMDEIVGEKKPEPLKRVEDYLADLKVPEKRVAALDGLMVLRDRAAAAALTEMLYSAADLPLEVRGRAGQALFLTLEPREAFELFRPILDKDAKVKWIEAQKGEGWGSVAAMVAQFAAVSGYQPIVPAVVEAYKKGVGRINRPPFMRMFGKFKVKDAVPLCVRALRDDADTAAPAAWALGEIGDPVAAPDIVETIESRLKKDRFSSSVYAEGARALGKMGAKTPEALKVLERLLVHHDEEARAGAADALGKVGEARHSDMLTKAAEKEPHDWVAAVMRASARTLEAKYAR